MRGIDDFKLVVVESPFAGNRRLNEYYLRLCLQDSFRRGEAPFASHRMYTDCLSDDIESERTMGIYAGLAWGRKAELAAFYTDLGISGGMTIGLESTGTHEQPYELRKLFPELTREEAERELLRQLRMESAEAAMEAEEDLKTP